MAFRNRVASEMSGPPSSRRAFLAASGAALLAGRALGQVPPAAAPSRIAFGSCAREENPQPIWDIIVESRPDLFILLGDNIYGDTEDMDLLRVKYAKLAAHPGFERLRAVCPVIATWDDHDYGVNDGGMEYPKRVESQKVFLDFFGEPAGSPRRRRAGVYESYTWGPQDRRLQVILLDTRYHRSPLTRRRPPVAGVGPYIANEDPAATILGAEQWEWLEQQLREPADLRIIGSSIQVVPEDHGWEKWMNHPRERERLYNLIRTTGAGGVLFISGDRHLAEISMMDGGVGYPLYDITSSGLNSASRSWRPYEVNRHRVGTMNWGDNFGMIDIDWSLPDPPVRLKVLDDAGDVAIQRKIRLSTLRPAPAPR